MKIRQARLPVGIDQFEKLREGGYYYVDKTELIEQVIEEGCEVTLFTRPRRFGKTLNMSMLQYFFEIGMNPTLFDGLYIAQNKDLCDAYMGRYPVVSISLKGVDADSYEKARAQLIRIINKEARRHRALLEDEKNWMQLIGSFLCSFWIVGWRTILLRAVFRSLRNCWKSIFLKRSWC